MEKKNIPNSDHCPSPREGPCLEAGAPALSPTSTVSPKTRGSPTSSAKGPTANSIFKPCEPRDLNWVTVAQKQPQATWEQANTATSSEIFFFFPRRLNFEFHIIFTRQKTLFFRFSFFNHLKRYKTSLAHAIGKTDGGPSSAASRAM